MFERKPPTQPMEQQPAPLALRVLGVLVMLVLAGLLAWWGVDLGRRLFGASHGELSVEQRLALAQADLTRITLERDQLLAAGDSKAAAGKQTAQTDDQIKSLEVENSKLVADLALAESLIPAEKPGTPLTIRGLQAELTAPDQLHYVLVLTRGEKKSKPQFSGQLQLALTVQQDGKTMVLQFPEAPDDPQYKVVVQRYQRLDGVKPLPAGVTVSAVQVKLLENGQIVAQQSSTVKDAHVRP